MRIRTISAIAAFASVAIGGGTLAVSHAAGAARVDTYAAASVNAVSQIAVATTMANTLDQRTMAGTSAETLVQRGYLSTVPAVPTGDAPVRLVGEDGRRDGEPAWMAVLRLDRDGAAVCARVASQAGALYAYGKV